MNKFSAPLKVLFWCFGGLVLFIGAWLAVNLWPRPMEPALWTDADLVIPEEREKNGYYFLVQMRGNTSLENLEVPDSLYEMSLLTFPESESDEIYLEGAKKFAPALSDFIQQRSAALQEYQRLLDFPQFIDQDPISLEPKSAPWLLLDDLQKIGTLDVMNEILKGDGEEAYDAWLKTFRMDRSWLFSARGALSHKIAVHAVHRDLTLLSLIRTLPSMKEEEKILKPLQNFDPEKINYRRALISEYLFSLLSAESIASEELQKESLWLRLMFNRALFRRELNDHFRRLEALLKDPKAITDETVRQFDQEFKGLRKSPFWWFCNPAGKTLRQLLFFDHAEQIRNFDAEKEAIREIRSRLLTQPSAGPAAAEETAPVCTQQALMALKKFPPLPVRCDEDTMTEYCPNSPKKKCDIPTLEKAYEKKN